MTLYQPPKRATSGTIGNLDGGSDGIGGSDVRIQSGTGDFLSGTNTVQNNTYTKASTAVVSIQNVGRGAGVYARTETSGVVSLRRISGGTGVSVTEVGDSIVVTSGAADVFTKLHDVPQSYQGQDGKFLRVNEATGALVFSDATRSTTSPTPPTSAQAGDSWWCTTNGSLFCYYINSDGFGAWAEVAN